MWLFGKDKDDKNKKGAASAPVAPSVPMTSKEAKTQELMAQMRTLRAEIGEETLQELAKKLRLDDLKKKVRHDIDNDPAKRARLLDELRYQVREGDE